MFTFTSLFSQTLRIQMFFLLAICFVIIAAAGSANGQAQEKLLYSFCQQPNCADGATPEGNVVIDKQGNVYGSTYSGCVWGRLRHRIRTESTAGRNLLGKRSSQFWCVD
jgi:hypothetical protein